MRDRVLELRRVPASDLRRNPKNWRRHPAHQAKALASVLERVGFAGALLARQTPEGLELIDGHLRAETTPDQEVPVLVLDVDEAEADLILATYDPLSAMASTDEDALRALLAITEIPDDVLGEMLHELSTTKTHKTSDVHADDVPEPPTEPRTQRGDIWTLGRHRLVCGDATEKADVRLALVDQRADLCLTDPPYGVEWDYRSTNDTTANLDRLISGFLPLAREVADVVLVTCGTSNMHRYPAPSWTLCWHIAAGVAISSWGFTCWQPVLAYGRDPYLSAGMGARPDALSQTETSPDVDHPCPKPVGVWRWLMERGTVAAGDVVFDPFLGSGTSIIAAEELDRTACGLELDPRYCDVIVERWEQFTGQTAERA